MYLVDYTTFEIVSETAWPNGTNLWWSYFKVYKSNVSPLHKLTYNVCEVFIFIFLIVLLLVQFFLILFSNQV